MSLLESELNRINVELAKNNPELNKDRELEKKLVPINPADFEEYKLGAIPIEQISLDQFGEEFELRVRREDTPEGPIFTGALKDKGEMEVIDGSIVHNRGELEVAITPETYSFYANNPRFPVKLKQLRGTIAPGLTVDFIEKEPVPVIELDTKNASERAERLKLLEGKVIDKTGDKTLSKNFLAHKHAGFEHMYHGEPLEQFAKRVVKEMIGQYAAGKNQVVTCLDGIAGAGKTTVTRMITEQLTELFGEQFSPTVVSTDDYHFGRKKLEEMYGAPYTTWDDARTYNTLELAFDIKRLAEGFPIIKRHFDFETEETVFDEEASISPFVIIEGLYAGSKDLASVRDLHFELPTGYATAAGRDSRRIVIEGRANRVFPTPESRLKYFLETILPLYLSQERPGRNSFSASTRPLASRAFMLAELNNL